ncbi:MAG: hypothetical protein DSY41_03365, partial [Candidatus Poseidoniales archaeon]
MVIMAPVYLSLAPTPELRASEPMSAGGDIEMKLYTLYIASQNSSAGGDGHITTEVPESGGQDSASALDSEVEFRSSDMLSSLIVQGRPQHGSSSGSYYLPLDLFLRATGPSGSTVEWTITLRAGGSQVGTESWSTEACTQSFTNSCSFDHEQFDIDMGQDQSFTLSKDERLEITVSAEMSGCDGGTIPGGSSCEAEVAWNEIDDENDRFSQLEVEANAMANSLVLLQREGAELAEGAELDWYPNDILSERTMQFSFDVKSAFGRYDIESTRLIMRDPGGVYRIDHIINEGDVDMLGDSGSDIIVEMDDIQPPKFVYGDKGGGYGAAGQGPGNNSERIRFSLPFDKFMDLVALRLSLPNLVLKSYDTSLIRP